MGVYALAWQWQVAMAGGNGRWQWQVRAASLRLVVIDPVFLSRVCFAVLVRLAPVAAGLAGFVNCFNVCETV
jgi:hypothetical protein